MELDELKKNWNVMEERLGQLEMELRQQQQKTVSSKLQRVRERIFRRFYTIAFIPLLFWLSGQLGYCTFSQLTWILLFVFMAVIVARQFTWWLLLKRIDCLKMTVREIYLAESRFRMFFKLGVTVGVLCMIPVLVSMVRDLLELDDRSMLTGMWGGFVAGLVVGSRVFFKSWSRIQELRKAIADLQ